MINHIGSIFYFLGVVCAFIVNTLLDRCSTLNNKKEWHWLEKVPIPDDKDGKMHRPHLKESFSMIILSWLIVLFSGSDLLHSKK